MSLINTKGLDKMSISISKKILAIIIIFLIATPTVISVNIINKQTLESNNIINDDSGNIKDNKEIINGLYKKDENYTIIRIAHYPKFSTTWSFKDYESGAGEASGSFVFNYTWFVNNKTYTFSNRILSLKEMMGKGEKPLNVENYDLLYVGVNYWSYIRDGVIKKLSNNIKKFLSEGGGYIGSCGGAIFASKGFKKPKDIYQRVSNRGVLKVADIYLNHDYFGEMQYVIRSKSGLPPLNLKVEDSSEVPIFKDYKKTHINLTYGGGAGLYLPENPDPDLGQVTPLLTFDEELMETKPLHWFRKGILPGWVPFKKVKTDLKGNYAGIATTYNNSGRIVLFAVHAEIPIIANGTIEEKFDFRDKYGSFGIIPRIVYYYNGEMLNLSKNFWIHRRAAAWVAGVSNEELPPTNELGIILIKPSIFGNYIYINDSLLFLKFPQRWLDKLLRMFGMSVIIGDITVEPTAESCKRVEYYIDGVLEYTDYSYPYKWVLDKNNFIGIHHLEVRGYDEYGYYSSSGSDFFFINT